jgi:two-component system, NarL family, nitrate/nitrite response regulator NarL
MTALEKTASSAQTDAGGMRVLLIDDHSLVAETIADFLERQGGCAVSVCTSAEAGQEQIKAEGSFDIVLLDYNLPQSDGLAALKALLTANRGRVAIFSGSVSRMIVEKALESGASGFVPKTLALKSLVNALHFMAAGEVYLPADFLSKAAGSSESVSLKPVEKRVLEYLSEGLQNKEIAGLLALSEVSVKMHVRSICTKLGAKNRTHAALIAKRDNIF